MKNYKYLKIRNIVIVIVCLLLITSCNLGNDKDKFTDNGIILFEDIKLKEALLENGVDANNDKEISIREANSYKGILDLSNNEIISADGIQHFINIKIIDLSQNNIKSLEPFFDMKNLTSLDLSNNDITDISMISSCINLIVLDLSSNKISNIEAVSKLENLEYLDLSYNNLINIDMISQCFKLKYLLVDNNDITDINSLRNLNISELWINDTLISSIPEEILHKLRKVNISNSKVNENDIMTYTEVIAKESKND
jgi:Leucine-rich repeat (LRR) protein